MSPKQQVANARRIAALDATVEALILIKEIVTHETDWPADEVVAAVDRALHIVSTGQEPTGERK